MMTLEQAIENRSRPSRTRGLKQLGFARRDACGSSRPSRTRGLKHIMLTKILEINRVASFADAWIETNMRLDRPINTKVASFADAWIETVVKFTLGVNVPGRVLRGRVD